MKKLALYAAKKAVPVVAGAAIVVLVVRYAGLRWVVGMVGDAILDEVKAIRDARE